MRSDANEFSRVTGNQPFRTGQYQEFLAGNWTLTAAGSVRRPGWCGKDARRRVGSRYGAGREVRYLGVASCTDHDLADGRRDRQQPPGQHRLRLVGEPADNASEVPVYKEIIQAGAAEGIGFLFSSGDSGYENPSQDPGSDMQQADFPP